MQLVINANVLFSALIKDSTTRKLIAKPNLILYTPEFFLKEFINHLWELKSKTNSNELMLKEKLQEFLTKNIRLTPSKKLLPYIPQARSICPDEGDIAYFALALKLNCPIWSDDKALKQQSKIKILSTQEILHLFPQT
jgi:predicted nucleic acid-binding protein